MPVMSYVEDERPGNGFGRENGNGNGNRKGHDKAAENAMADGEYGLNISGVDVDNPTAVNEISPQTTLADGTKLNTEVRQGSITIAEAPAGGSDGDALRLETDSNNGRLRLNVEFDANNRMTLGELDDLKFDFFVQSTSNPNSAPVFRLIIDADGDLTTTGDRGQLVFERVYQGLGNTPLGSWDTADLTGGDWIAWQFSNGQNRDQIVNMTTFSDWSDDDGFTPAGGLNFNENSVVMGWQLALGSGNGTVTSFVDDLIVGGVTYDFSI